METERVIEIVKEKEEKKNARKKKRNREDESHCGRKTCYITQEY